jgi:hypothetical protein
MPPARNTRSTTLSRRSSGKTTGRAKNAANPSTKSSPRFGIHFCLPKGQALTPAQADLTRLAYKSINGS